MEKFESKVDIAVFAIFVTFCLLDVATFVVWAIFGIWCPTLVMLGITTFFVIPPYFFTWYRLTEDSLKINCGYFMINRTIPYDSILSIRPIIAYSLAPALSSRRIEIIYYKKNKSRRVLISPGMYSTFLNILSDSALESTVAQNRLSLSREDRFESPAKVAAPAKPKTEPATTQESKPKKAAVKKPVAKTQKTTSAAKKTEVKPVKQVAIEKEVATIKAKKDTAKTTPAKTEKSTAKPKTSAIDKKTAPAKPKAQVAKDKKEKGEEKASPTEIKTVAKSAKQTTAPKSSVETPDKPKTSSE